MLGALAIPSNWEFKRVNHLRREAITHFALILSLAAKTGIRGHSTCKSALHNADVRGTGEFVVLEVLEFERKM
jgi:hypothetical protein